MTAFLQARCQKCLWKPGKVPPSCQGTPTVQSCWDGSFPSFCAQGLALISSVSLIFVSNSNPPSGYRAHIFSRVLSNLSGEFPTRLSLWAVLILFHLLGSCPCPSAFLVSLVFVHQEKVAGFRAAACCGISSEEKGDEAG